MNLSDTIVFRDTPEVRSRRGIKPIPDERNKLKFDDWKNRPVHRYIIVFKSMDLVWIRKEDEVVTHGPFKKSFFRRVK